jgi:hypothetical protein
MIENIHKPKVMLAYPTRFNKFKNFISKYGSKYLLDHPLDALSFLSTTAFTTYNVAIRDNKTVSYFVLSVEAFNMLSALAEYAKKRLVIRRRKQIRNI